MGDSRIHIRYVGTLASDFGSGGGNETTASSATATIAAATTTTWVATPSADTSLRELVDGILSDVDRRLCSSTRTSTTDAVVRVVPSFGCGRDAILVLSKSNGASAGAAATNPNTSTVEHKQLTLFDITLHPIQNLTSKILAKPDISGVNSVTLQELGWYPSARLAVCYADDAGGDAGVVHELIGVGAGAEAGEGEYNRASVADDGSTAMMVRLTGDAVRADGDAVGDGYRPKPSQIMASVADRDVGATSSANANHANGGDNTACADDAHTERMRKATERRQREGRRKARLDEAIRRIDEKVDKKKKGSGSTSSNAKVSAQVKRMLIKSRAVGTNTSLREQDRFYLEVVYVDDHGGNSGDVEEDQSDVPPSYRYFSRVATAGQVASTSAPRPRRGGGDSKALVRELLVKRKEGGEGEYRKLPSPMPLHQAEEGGFLNQFDRVIVRAHGVNDDATPSIIDVDNCDDDGDVKMDKCDEPMESSSSSSNDHDGVDKDSDVGEEAKDHAAMDEEGSTSSTTTQTDSLLLSERISRAIEEAEAAAAASSAKGKPIKKKKKKSATSDKVRQMLIKSKATGDKRSIKDIDRFYLEVVIVTSTAMGELKALGPPCPYFFNRMATLEVIVSKLGFRKDGNVKILAKDANCGNGKEAYHELPDHTARLCDAEKEANLHQYACLVVIQ